ncbi:MAG: hypothetical protein ACLQDY_10875 [Streptosporangiaceae bacterium]
MTARRRPAAAAAAGLAALLLAACGSTVSGATLSRSEAAAPPPLATSITAANGTSGAIVVMGGSAARHNNFWQLFVRPSAAAAWRLVTPPGMADNGGLYLATVDGRTLVVGFGGSQLITFSPVAVSADDGAHWSQAAPVYPGLAETAAALAAGPGDTMLALTKPGEVERGTRSGASWQPVVSEKQLARTTAGRACGLTRLTAVALTPAGVPLIGGACARPGTAALFTPARSGWRATGPALPGSVAHEPAEVVSLRSAGSRTTALLRVGAGRDSALLLASADGRGAPAGPGSWRLSPLLRIGPAAVLSASASADGSAGLVLAGNRGYWSTGSGAGWHQLPALPAHTQALTAGPGGQIDALAASGSTMTGWLLARGAAAWTAAQHMHVPIQYGSSS